MKNKCPYLESGIICTFKRFGANSTRHRMHCGFKNIANCPCLQQSMSKLVDLDILDEKIDSGAVKTSVRAMSNGGRE